VFQPPAIGNPLAALQPPEFRKNIETQEWDALIYRSWDRALSMNCQAKAFQPSSDRFSPLPELLLAVAEQQKVG
jgi:hypothetical protein